MGRRMSHRLVYHIDRCLREVGVTALEVAIWPYDKCGQWVLARRKERARR